MSSNKSIQVLDTEVKVKTVEQDVFICLTDIAKSKTPEHPDDLIRNWLRNRNTLELLSIWEQLYNPNFNSVEFDGIKSALPQAQRLTLLNNTAIQQMRLLTEDNSMKKLQGGQV